MNKFNAGTLVVVTDTNLMERAGISCASASAHLLQPFVAINPQPDSNEGEDNPFFGGTVSDEKVGFTIPVAGLKQVAYYNPDEYKRVEVGIRGTVEAVDHPLLGTRFVHTTEVLKYDEATGVFETKNTVYYPRVVA